MKIFVFSSSPSAEIVPVKTELVITVLWFILMSFISVRVYSLVVNICWLKD